ncbi:MAG: VanZ family protein [Clostridiales bacterium]|nr:VanZ family protein [Clostridiales bacterium]
MGTNTIKRFLLAAVLLAVFVGFSFQFISAPPRKRRSEYRSTDLKRVVTKEGNVIRTDYTDADGKPRIAADAGYATRLTVQQNDRETEIFLDDRGERIIQYCGYYGIRREYDAAGNNIRITYLDENDTPTVMALNYAVEERAFNASGQLVSCSFFDTEGNPTLSSDGGFGIRYEYDDKGRRSRITYLDAKGDPMILQSGYCTLVREYYETDGPGTGKARREFYYLPDGTAALLPLGQSGEYTEYDKNGQISLKKYLDADGLPMVTNKGYTSVTYTYYANNSVQSVLYFDINGNPFRMSEGQYGTKDENGLTVYLNADGSERFNVKNYVYNHPGFVVIIAIMLIVLSTAAGRKLNWTLLILYISAIVYFTLMYREKSGAASGTLRSFSVFTSAEARAGFFQNIWLFVPLGAILFRLWPRKIILLAPVLLSIIIEATQYFSGTGFCELSDVAGNGLGGAIGYGTGFFTESIRRQLNSKKVTAI